ncbi:MAG: large conductance mechanosensitive channel protein MscL [Verrucomicrobia bacterium]|nr:large conductance mechanosensitive channel protein MscL [Verrucomicrobiota bacterium]
MSMINEFKEFATKGNIVDLAAGVIIGVAFGNVVTSVVNDILMPPIGKLLGGVNFTDLFLKLDPSKLAKDGSVIKSLAQAKEAGAAVIAYGSFINTVIDFTIVAFCIFMIVKAKNRLEPKPAPSLPAATPEPTKEEKVLEEIRDILKAIPELRASTVRPAAAGQPQFPSNTQH